MALSTYSLTESSTSSTKAEWLAENTRPSWRTTRTRRGSSCLVAGLMPRVVSQYPSSVAVSNNCEKAEYDEPGPTYWPSRAGMLRYTSNSPSASSTRISDRPFSVPRLRPVELDCGVPPVRFVVVYCLCYVGQGQSVFVQISGFRRGLRGRSGIGHRRWRRVVTARNDQDCEACHNQQHTKGRSRQLAIDGTLVLSSAPAVGPLARFATCLTPLLFSPPHHSIGSFGQIASLPFLAAYHSMSSFGQTASIPSNILA